MELILITGRKLKIMLTAADMENYRLDCGNMDYDNTETRRAFRSILDEAGRRTGFDAASDKVMIEVYPCKSGGCELFVTKLARKSGADIIGVSEILYGIYIFEELEKLLRVCRLLSESGFDGRADAYSYENGGPRGKYYLVLFGRSDKKARYSFVGEYGAKCRNGKYLYFIKEHCARICKGDAVGVLGDLYL